MIIYNVTVKVDRSIAEAWLKWLNEEHIPEVVATGCFTHAVVLQLLETDNTDGPTYAIQYHAPSKGLYNNYIENHAPLMRQKGIDKWGDRFVAFRSVLQVVN